MKISPGNPFYYLTSVTKNRLPVFRRDDLKRVVCNALDEARQSSGILIFAYVIMADHFHMITDSSKSIPDTLRFFNGIAARRVIDYLKDNDYLESLQKLSVEAAARNHKYSLWDAHPNSFSINNEKTLLQKVNYIHLNPVRAGIVTNPNDYKYSSSRLWTGRQTDEEPLLIDVDQIEWRNQSVKRRSRR